MKTLQKEHAKSLKDDNKQKIKEIKKEIDEINTLKKNLLFTKQQYYEVGGKSLKLLSYRLRKPQADRTIHKIRNSATSKIETNL